MLTKRITLLLLFCVGYCAVSAYADTYKDNLSRLYRLSLNNINISSAKMSDSIITFCRELEPQARAKGDNLNLFMIGQIHVNASCLKGDIATAITKTKEMYEEAEKKGSAEGIILSLQAFGNTYMNTRQYIEAQSSFAEAEKKAKNITDEMLRVRLALQQLYASLALHSSNDATHYLEVLEAFPLTTNNNLLAAQTLYYKISLDLLNNDINSALKHYTQLTNEYGTPGELWILHQMIMARYYMVEGSFDIANSIIDSLLNGSLKSINTVEYRDIIWLKARILSLSEQYDPACELYEKVRILSDSININRYVKSVDTLRAAYDTNQLKLGNISSRNRLITQSTLLTLALLIAATLFFLTLKRKNRQLRRSQEELLRLTDAATRSIQTKSLFLSNMSHDLRTPLNAIAGFSNLLADEEEVDKESKKMYGEYIQQNSELLLKLFNDILDLSALNENKMLFQIGMSNVTTLCRNVTDTVRSLKSDGNEILFESLAGDISFNTDSSRLQQVLINLLTNATKFTQSGTIRLIIDVSKNGQEAVFMVEDTGCGIPLEKQSGIFERFEKLNEKKQGAGLGLSICKLIVDRLGGRIWIDPNYSGGARFIFTHPLNLK